MSFLLLALLSSAHADGDADLAGCWLQAAEPTDQDHAFRAECTRDPTCDRSRLITVGQAACSVARVQRGVQPESGWGVEVDLFIRSATGPTYEFRIGEHDSCEPDMPPGPDLVIVDAYSGAILVSEDWNTP